MCISSLRLTFPFCCPNLEEQSRCSQISRTAAIGIGVIALLAGIVILSGLTGLPSLTTREGALLAGFGAVVLIAGICLKSVKEHSIEPDADTIDFSQITPLNFKKHLELNKPLTHQSRKPGDLVFTIGKHENDFNAKGTFRNYKKNQEFLDGIVVTKEGGTYGACDLEISEDKFVHYPQMNKPGVVFSNLKEFLDYLFQGNFYQGVYTKDLESISVRKADGKEIRYRNPYLADKS